jgi:predicted N-formylglutamate amidohydrolase
MNRRCDPVFIVTCEHASNDVPEEARDLFRPHPALRRSHRGYDIGALPIAEHLAASLAAPIFIGRWTRLLVDLNRSDSNQAVFSEISRTPDQEQRRRLIHEYHAPYRSAVQALAWKLLPRAGFLLHLSVHTFTPVLHNKVRNVDVGLLFDPSVDREQAICRRWRKLLAASRPGLRVHLNRPYRGTSDGMTTHLRGVINSNRYVGIEIEVNQQIAGERPKRDRIAQDLLAALRSSLECSDGSTVS